MQGQLGFKTIRRGLLLVLWQKLNEHAGTNAHRQHRRSGSRHFGPDGLLDRLLQQGINGTGDGCLAQSGCRHSCAEVTRSDLRRVGPEQAGERRLRNCGAL